MGHSCNKPKLYLLDELKIELQEESDEVKREPLDTETKTTLQQAELLGISLHAIVGFPSPKTMRLVGRIDLQPVIILIESNYIINVERKAKLPLKFD